MQYRELRITMVSVLGLVKHRMTRDESSEWRWRKPHEIGPSRRVTMEKFLRRRLKVAFRRMSCNFTMSRIAAAGSLDKRRVACEKDVGFDDIFVETS